MSNIVANWSSVIASSVPGETIKTPPVSRLATTFRVLHGVPYISWVLMGIKWIQLQKNEKDAEADFDLDRLMLKDNRVILKKVQNPVTDAGNHVYCIYHNFPPLSVVP